MNDEMVREAIDDSEDSFIGPLAGAFPELANLTDADLEWAREQWQRGLERQFQLASSTSTDNDDWVSDAVAESRRNTNLKLERLYEEFDKALADDRLPARQPD